MMETGHLFSIRAGPDHRVHHVVSAALAVNHGGMGLKDRLGKLALVTAYADHPTDYREMGFFSTVSYLS